MKKFLLFFICLFLIPKTSDAITWYNGWSEAAKAAEGKGGKVVPCSPEGKYSLCYSSSSYCNPSSNCYSCYYEDSSRCGSCSSGYTLSNGRCFSTSDGPVPKCAAYKYNSCSSWYCEGDYTYTNGKCVKTVSCSGNYHPSKEVCESGNGVEKCDRSRVQPYYDSGCWVILNCKEGFGSNQQGQCVKTVSCSGNYHPSKEVCESGNGVEKCDRSWVQPYQDNGCWVILKCKEGFGSNQQGQCVKTVSCSGSTPVESMQSDGSIKCSCSSTSCGANAKCIRHPKYNANTLQNNYSYCICNSGYIMENGTCVQEKKAAINGNCPSDMKKSDDGCCCILN